MSFSQCVNEFIPHKCHKGRIFHDMSQMDMSGQLSTIFLCLNSSLTGYGVGSILGGLFRHILPLIKRGGKAIGKELLNTSMNVINDVSDAGISLKEAVKARGREGVSNLKRKAISKLGGDGIKIGGLIKKRKKNQSSKGSTKPKTSKKRAQTKKKATKRKKTKKKKSIDFNIFSCRK